MSCAPLAICNVSSAFQGVTEIECLARSTCHVECGGNDPAGCTLVCRSGATCSNEQAYESDVTFTCEADADCDIQCAQGGVCNVACAAGANCSVSGANGSTPDGEANCASGTCDYAFTTGTPVGLAITCENDATCNVTTGYAGSISDISCEGTSTCNISCGGAATCTYTCADTATCTCSGDGTCTEL
jgi:hypothetical protein